MTAPTLTTYGGALRDLGYAGQPVDGNPCTIESKANSASVAIDFGVAVARSSADDNCKAPAADGDIIIGLSVRHAIMPAVSGVVNYLQYAEVPIMKEGYLYVTAYENVVRGDGAISVTAQNGKISGTTAGAAGTGRVGLDGTGGKIKAIWETTTTAGNVGICRVTG